MHRVISITYKLVDFLDVALKRTAQQSQHSI